MEPKATKMNKQNKMNLDTENRLVVTRGEGDWGMGGMVKGVNCMVMNGKWTCGGDHFVVYTDVKL